MIIYHFDVFSVFVAKQHATFKRNDVISVFFVFHGSAAAPVVKLLSKRWWIPAGARLEGPKLEPEGPRAEVGFPTAYHGFSSIQGTLFGFYGI